MNKSLNELKLNNYKNWIISDLILNQAKNFPKFNIIEFIDNEKWTYEDLVSKGLKASFRLKKNGFIDEKSKKKIPDETIKLLYIQKDMMIKQLIQFPDLYYAKSHFPLELSQRAFDHLWRICESYELWCKETNQTQLIVLNFIDLKV